MATLKTNTLTGTSTAGSIAVTGEGNSTTTNLQQGLVKCWADFDGSGTPALTDSFNSASITDNGTGDYTVSYTNNMASGNYVFTDTLASLNCPGVDSILHIDLTILTNLNLNIFAITGVAFVTQTGVQYQWLDCDNGYAEIPGETDQDYLPATDGNYACILTAGSCVDTTACVFVEATNSIDKESMSPITVYPNPFTDQLYISNQEDSPLSVRVFNVLGAEILAIPEELTDTLQIDMSMFADGVYHVVITTSSGTYVKKVIKE